MTAVSHGVVVPPAVRWALIAVTAVVAVVVCVVIWRREEPLSAAAIAEVQQVLGTILAVLVGTLAVLRADSGLYPGSLAAGAGFGVVGPRLAMLGRVWLPDDPWKRLIVGWLAIWLAAYLPPSLATGRAGQWVMWVTMAVSAAAIGGLLYCAWRHAMQPSSI